MTANMVNRACTHNANGVKGIAPAGDVAGIREQADGPQPKVTRAAATRPAAQRPAEPLPMGNVVTSDLVDRACPRFASGANEITSAGCCGRPREGRPPLANHPASEPRSAS